MSDDSEPSSSDVSDNEDQTDSSGNETPAQLSPELPPSTDEGNTSGGGGLLQGPNQTTSRDGAPRERPTPRAGDQNRPTSTGQPRPLQRANATAGRANALHGHTLPPRDPSVTHAIEAESNADQTAGRFDTATIRALRARANWHREVALGLDELADRVQSSRHEGRMDGRVRRGGYNSTRRVYGPHPSYSGAPYGRPVSRANAYQGWVRRHSGN